MSAVTAHLVCGPPGSGKSALIRRRVAERRAWLGFVNAADRYDEPMLRLAPSGCPCCTARVVMQVELARALRETRPQRVLVEIVSADHLADVERTLHRDPLGRYLMPGRPVWLPADAALTADALERS